MERAAGWLGHGWPSRKGGARKGMWFDMYSRTVASSGAAPATLPGRRLSWPGSRAVLVVVLGLSTLAACDDFDGRDYGRAPGFGPGRRGGDDGWGRWHRRHRDHGRPGAGVDAGPDAGARADAGLADAGGSPGSTDLDAGVADAGAAGSTGADAGAVDAAILALSDGQILAVADALLAGEIDQARAAEPRLGDPEVLAFAEQTAAEREAARSTLASLASAIEVAAEPSAVADDVLAENASALETLAEPDAGALDAGFLSSRGVVHARALERFGALAAAADAPALRAQLVVLEALERAALELARELAAGP